MSHRPPGLLAGFATPDAFRDALHHLRAAGYTRLEAFMPWPVDGVGELLQLPRTPVARIMGLAALLGASGAYGLQYWATHDYPLNVGGRPLHSWPAFIPITFELTVLTVSITGVIALLWLCGLPRLHHPVFHAAAFARASQDRYFIRVRSDDPQFDPRETRTFLAALAPDSLEEVPS
jgi:hypothetical protein